MGRPVGRKNDDFEATRAALLSKVSFKLMTGLQAKASFRELAEAAEVSPATLRHYFRTRDGLLAEVMAFFHAQGGQFIADAGARPVGEVRASLAWMLRAVAESWTQHGVGRILTLGLQEGLAHPVLGPSYVNELLEPILQAAEVRIARHIAQGELKPTDVRAAALTLMSPLVMALLHQQGLFGSQCRPLDVDALVEYQLDRFLESHGTGRPAKHDA